MSGLLRSLSGMDESGVQRGQGDAKSTERNLGNGHNSSSALKFFGTAKKKINDIFRDIGDYIVEVDKYVEGIVVDKEIVGPECKDDVEGFRNQLQGITEVLARDHMKVVFFGRTSNGKSTAINAMLREKILPSGIGHTTNCFLQVEGAETQEGFLLTEDSNQPKSIGSIKQLASAISSAKLESNALIRILWPKEKCRLLKDDVVLVDSPGIDVSPDLDTWIDKFCLDADVFVLVGNAESTLMQTEKNFFHKVSSRLSKPNIFILQNRWDISATEEDIEEVRKQHLERNMQFLVEELKVAEKQEAEDRVFFVSAREALVSRLHKDKGTPTPTGSLQEGFQARLFDFANFERLFEECISKSAVKTKFEQHTARGKTITSEVKQLMDKAFTNSLQIKEDETNLRREKSDDLDYLKKQLEVLTKEIKDKIRSVVEDVERKVSSALNEEIRRLSIVVDEFDVPFHPDAMSLSGYKKELHAHVEDGLGRNLQTRCSAALIHATEIVQREMTDRLIPLLCEDQKQQIHNILPKRDFDIAYRLDCRNLCADFKENILFRFSLGPTALMQRWLSPTSARSVMRTATGSVPRPMTPQTPTDEGNKGAAENEMMLSFLTKFASLTSRTTVGSIIVIGIAAKTIGWRVIGVTGTLYGLLYLYERLTWTTKAKERAFKQQYVDYASSKLRLIVDLTSANCSHQVQQELASKFSQLCRHVDQTKQKLVDELKQVDIDITKLQETANRAKMLRNKADFLDGELNNFIKQYLQNNH